MQNTLEPLAVSASEAARLLGVKAHDLPVINRQDFPSFRLGNRTLVSVEGLREWIHKRTMEDVI